MPVEYTDYSSRATIRSNQHKLYLFAENAERYGYAGDAREMRDEPNAHGVRTHYNPRQNDTSRFHDRDYQRCAGMIDADLRYPEQWLELGRVVVIPEGIAAKLTAGAPEIGQHLTERLAELTKTYGAAELASVE